MEKAAASYKNQPPSGTFAVSNYSFRPIRMPLLTVRDAKTGKTEVIEADYLVGPLGYSSSVRDALGIRMPPEELIDYSLNIEFLTKDLAQPAQQRPRAALRHDRPGGHVGVSADGRRREDGLARPSLRGR